MCWSKKLKKEYTGKYCDCCGVESKKIWENIIMQKKKGKTLRQWKGHVENSRANSFFSINPVAYCQECGKRLTDDDMNFHKEYLGECHGIPQYEYLIDGYECCHCGFQY